MKVQSNDGEYSIIGDDMEIKKSNEKEENKEPKTFQKSLIASPNTIYSNNN